jgi:hypothetical protein
MTWQRQSDLAGEARWLATEKPVIEALWAHSRSVGLHEEAQYVLERLLELFRHHEGYQAEVRAAAAERAGREEHDARQEGTKLLGSLVFKGLTGSYEGEGAGKRALWDITKGGIGAGISEARNERRRGEMEAVRQRAAGRVFRAHAEEIMTSIERSVSRLARERGWRSVGPGARSWSFEKKLGEGLLDLEALPEFVERTSRAPDADTLVEGAQVCARAAELVPAGRVYDRYRGEVLVGAGTLAILAAAVTWRDEGVYGSPASRLAVRIARTIQSCGDEGAKAAPLALVASLDLAGRHAEALRVARTAEAWSESPDFAYLVARCSSMCGLHDQALSWLRKALQLGWTNLELCRGDRELAPLRAAKPTEFAAMTAPELRVGLAYFAFRDDLWVENRSLFPITGLRAEVAVIEKDRRPVKHIEAERIGPGEKLTWEGAFSLRRFAVQNIEIVSWSCDQDPDRAE